MIAFVANGERGGRSWGLLKKGRPVFPCSCSQGNDSCLFPDVVTDETVPGEILASKREMQRRRIFDIPIPKDPTYKGRAHSYYDIISELYISGL